MMNKNKHSNLADAIIDTVMKYKKEKNNNAGLKMALEGSGPFLVEARPNFGHDYRCILDAIYRYYKKHPEDRIDVYLYETFIKFSKISIFPYKVNQSLNIFLKQIENQRNGTSPFEVDMVSVLNELKNTIHQNNLNKNSEYINIVNRFDEYLESEMGYKIL